MLSQGQIYADLADVRAKREKAKQTEITSWKKRKKVIEDGQVKDKFRGTLVQTTASEER